MPRKHHKQLGSRPYKNYEDVTVERALEEYANGSLSLREAEESYGIPHATLYRKYRGQHPGNPGRPSVLGPAEEVNIVKAITTAANWGYPFDKKEIRELVKTYLDRKGIVEHRFKENWPGQDWVESFLNRHKDLTARTAQNIKRCRSEVTAVEMNEYFDNLEECLKDIEPDNILNYDETNLTDDPGQSRVIVRRGIKRPVKIMDHSKASTSVMFCVSASGTTLPPYIVYKAKHLYPEWIEGGDPDFEYNRSKSGWFDGTIFEDWFFKIVIPYYKNREGKKAIIGDNLAAHLSIKIIEECEKRGILFIFLPPNSTHVCQPLDVAYFKPLKSNWRRILNVWKRTHRGCIPKSTFPGLLRQTLQELRPRSEQNIQSGFRSAGIFPVNRMEVIKRLPGFTETDHSDILSEAFEDIIKKNVVMPPKETPKKRKRLNVKPGESVSLNSLAAPAGTSGENSTGHTDSESDGDNIATADVGRKEDKYGTDGEDDYEESNVEPEIEPELCMVNLREGVFIVVQFRYNEGTKKECLKNYVCKITAVKKKSYTVSCLRRYKETKNMFVYPNIEDENNISFENVKRLLTNPTLKRGKLIFDNDVDL